MGFLIEVNFRKGYKIGTNSGCFGKRRFGKNMAADVRQTKYAETSHAKKICRNVSHDIGKTNCRKNLYSSQPINIVKQFNCQLLNR